MITDILFDMGGVLIDFNPVFFTESFSPTAEDRELLINSVYYSPVWHMLDTGELTNDEALKKMCESLPDRLHSAAYNMVHNWPEIVRKIEGMPELVKELKERGYRLSLLTNAQLSHEQYWDKLDFYPEYFEGRIMLSSRWNVVKPDRDFYEKAIELLGLVPENCVFVDDMPQNAEGAANAGIDGIRFQGTVDLKHQLIERGIL